jgi:pimeloyl-ACP methyl ester carboxylesterase
MNPLVKLVAGMGLLAFALTPMMATAQEGPNDVQPSQNLVLKGIGSFFMEGNTHYVNAPYSYGSSQPGNVMINQMYVQFMKPAKNNNQWPIVFVHGCCLSSKSWQTTPDGRMGWDEYFVRQGFDVYLADQVGRARSGFNGLQYQIVRYGDAPGTTNPEIRLPTDAFAWSTFRWGNFATLTPHTDIRFPMQTVGVGPNSNLTFYKQVIPDMTATLDTSPPGCSGGGCYVTTPGAFHNTSKGMSDLANDLGGAILVGHSQSSSHPTLAALQAGSHSVKGIIQIETGCFGNLDAGDIAILKDIPILIIYGDYANGSPITAACQKEIKEITDAGGDIKFAWLPQLVPNDLYPGSPGPIYGNEHMMMLDKNNLDIADILINWINYHVKGPKKVAKN